MSNILTPTALSTGALPHSPYKGLMPYSEEDAPFFFGREAEREIIISNMMAWRLTLLYGASGVGKSSVLRAEIVNELRRQAQENFIEQGQPRYAVVYFSSWRDDPLTGLVKQVESAVSRAWEGEEFPPLPSSRRLPQILQAWTERLEGEILIILDQFEEYFLYHGQEDGEGTFAYEFAQAVNKPDLRVSFLISIREDALAKLDRFKGRIPGLFDNYLRIEHLNPEAARDAIEKPLAEYNNRLKKAESRRMKDEGGQNPGSPLTPQNHNVPENSSFILHPSSFISIEPQLVEAVLEQTKAGQVTLGETGRGELNRGREGQIETPYLQLVMTRLWNEERQANSSVLRLETLNRLGGAERIVRTHLDAVMQNLPPAEQEIAAQIFRFLVTPSGTKIAFSLPDLAEYAKVEPRLLAPVLEKLAGPEVRILRPVASPFGQAGATRYEIFHDVMAPAVLDWRARYIQEQERIKTEEALSLAEKARLLSEQQLVSTKRQFKWLRLGLIPLGVIAVSFAAVLTYLYINQQQQNDNYYSVCEAVIANQVPANGVAMFNELGVPDPVMEKLVKKGVNGITIVKVSDNDFKPETRAAIAAQYRGKQVVGLRLQVAIVTNGDYAIVPTTKIDTSGKVDTIPIRVNYDKSKDSWKVDASSGK
jgi:hypothetical protein